MLGNVVARRIHQFDRMAPGRLLNGRILRKNRMTHGTPCQQQRRGMAIYAIGDGWTGVLGENHTSTSIPGHQDEDDTENPDIFRENPPVRVYDGTVKQVAAGWGHTAVLDNSDRVHWIGRPHELQSLLRLNRLPAWIRNPIARNINTQRRSQQNSIVTSIIGFATGSGKEHPSQKDITWDDARALTFLPDWTPLEISMEPRGAAKIAANAGLTAILGKSGTLYMVGLNNRGQCGVGKLSNNTWTPQRVSGLTTAKIGANADGHVEQEEPMVDVSLGLQHGLALSISGNVYSWGKANRGQLGREVTSDQDTFANVVVASKATQIACGMHHGVYLTTENEIYLWGKNMSVDEETKKMKDAKSPQRLMPISKNNNNAKQIMQISCGSHHVSVLLEDGSVYAYGIAADISDAPVVLEPVELIPAGLMQMPLRQFEAHQDRTTIVDGDGNVYQAHLWKDKALQNYAMFTPGWAGVLSEQQEIQSVHRGWLHTLIVTSPKVA